MGCQVECGRNMHEQHIWGVGWSAVGAFKGVGTTHLGCWVECCGNMQGHTGCWGVL